MAIQINHTTETITGDTGAYVMAHLEGIAATGVVSGVANDVVAVEAAKKSLKE